MKITSTMLSCLFFVICLSYPMIAAEWRGIKPLYSTRKDVESLLGVQTSGKDFDEYTLGTDHVSIYYTTKRCAEGVASGYNVPIGTVFEITVTPKIQPSLSALKFDLSKFKVEYTDSEGEQIYENNEDGIYLTVVKEKVRHFVYSASTTKDRHLFCKAN